MTTTPMITFPPLTYCGGMTLISLFAGIGGFDLGFQRAGVKTVATVEIDANCRKLLKAKWPDAVHLDDVRTSGQHNLPECDIVTFGFPCQDLSVAGKRAGLEGKRSGLFYEAMRIIDELQPAWAVWENVPGLLSSDNGRDLARVLFRMGESGYFGCVRCLDAQWFGVAQRRRRLFGVFTRLDSGAERCAEILSLQESLRGHPAPRREAGEGITHSIAPSIAASGRGTERTGETRGQDCVIPAVAVPEIAGTLKACGGKSGGWSNSVDHAAAGYMVPYVARTVSCNGAQGADSDTKPGHLIPIAFERRFVRTSGGQPNDTGVHPCLRSDSNTGDGAPCVASGMSVRRLTPRECERLQGFPDNHTSGFSDSVRYKMLGNAVCVNVAEWIAKRMVSVRQNMNGEDKA